MIICFCVIASYKFFTKTCAKLRNAESADKVGPEFLR